MLLAPGARQAALQQWERPTFVKAGRGEQLQSPDRQSSHLAAAIGRAQGPCKSLLRRRLRAAVSKGSCRQRLANEATDRDAYAQLGGAGHLFAPLSLCICLLRAAPRTEHKACKRRCCCIRAWHSLG